MSTAPQTISPRATLNEVAELAGVSLTTASRALSGQNNVNDKTKKRILDAASRLNYQRNSAASLLASRQLADSIGLITGDFTNPFYSSIADAVEEEIREHGILLSVANARESEERELSLVQALAARQTRALIVVSSLKEHALYSEIAARGIPVVFVDRPADDIEADSVAFNNRQGGQLVAQHLRDRGHVRIAFIGDYSWLPTYQGRLAGMGDILDDNPCWRELVRTDAHDTALARRATQELLDLPEPPTAIVAGNNRILLGVTQELASRPAETRPTVIGFDDPEWAEVLGITVATGDPDEMGHTAARMALLRLSKRTQPVEHVVLPMRLIDRSKAPRR